MSAVPCVCASVRVSVSVNVGAVCVFPSSVIHTSPQVPAAAAAAVAAHGTLLQPAVRRYTRLCYIFVSSGDAFLPFLSPALVPISSSRCRLMRRYKHVRIGDKKMRFGLSVEYGLRGAIDCGKCQGSA